MGKVKSEYEKRLDAFYDIEDDSLLLTPHSADNEPYKEVFTKLFASLTDEEIERLKKKHGSEWKHIENHFRRLKKDGE